MYRKVVRVLSFSSVRPTVRESHSSYRPPSIIRRQNMMTFDVVLLHNGHFVALDSIEKVEHCFDTCNNTERLNTTASSWE